MIISELVDPDLNLVHPPLDVNACSVVKIAI